MATEARRGATGFGRRLTTETKQAFKTSEFWVYVIVFACLVIAGSVTDAEDEVPDVFNADQVWLYVTLLTIGYMVSRGLAKSGAREPYTDTPPAEGEGAPITDRVRAAASALREGEAPGGTSGGTTRAP